MNPIIKTLLRQFVRVARPHLRFTGLLQTSGVFNRSALVWQPGAERVLVLAPHMDDETIGCGGTIALHAQRGAQVTVVFLTDGRNGGAGIGALSGDARRRKQDELVALRQIEARNALAALGIQDMRCLDVPDGELAAQSSAAAEKLRAILREVRPGIVYLPLFIDEHADHRAASEVLVQAATGVGVDFNCAGYEVWTPLYPNCFVNIDATAALKETALKQYASQLQDGDYFRAAMGLSAYRSIALLGARGSYAEAFFVCPLARYRSLHAQFHAAHTAPRRAAQAGYAAASSTSGGA